MEKISIEIKNCNLGQIAESGQCFRWEKQATDYRENYTAYLVRDGADEALLEQRGRRITINCAAGRGVKWLDYLDVGRDYAAIVASIQPTDAYLRRCAVNAAGVRILNADLWEIMASFIISQNNNIPRIKSTIAKMCEKLGKAVGGPFGVYYAFPEPAALADLDALQGLGLGYRDKYIARLAQNVLEGAVDLEALAHMGDDEAHTYLKSIFGVGEKVSNCILLFGLGRRGALPVDTWLQRVIAREYGGKFPVELYPGTAGVIQQYIFFSERGGKK